MRATDESFDLADCLEQPGSSGTVVDCRMGCMQAQYMYAWVSR